MSIVALAEGVSGETELGTDGKGEPFISQYVFYDTERSNLLTRLFWVEGVLNRGEFAYGPTLKMGEVGLKLQFGGTTNRDLMLGANIFSKIKNRDVFYIVDWKISTTDRPNTVYQKGWYQINGSGSWQFRVEDLQVGSKQAFLRIGVEYRRDTSKTTHLFVAPFVDPTNRGFGGQLGFRFWDQ